MVSKFNYMDEVLHVKTGVKYHILAVPRSNLRLEYCNEPYYEYRFSAVMSEVINTKISWVRCQSEMEDGRFILVKK